MENRGCVLSVTMEDKKRIVSMGEGKVKGAVLRNHMGGASKGQAGRT